MNAASFITVMKAFRAVQAFQSLAGLVAKCPPVAQRFTNQRVTLGNAAMAPSSSPASTIATTIHRPRPRPMPGRAAESPHASKTASVSSRSFSGLLVGGGFDSGICRNDSASSFSGDVSGHLAFYRRLLRSDVRGVWPASVRRPAVTQSLMSWGHAAHANTAVPATAAKPTNSRQKTRRLGGILPCVSGKTECVSSWSKCAASAFKRAFFWRLDAIAASRASKNFDPSGSDAIPRARSASPITSARLRSTAASSRRAANKESWKSRRKSGRCRMFGGDGVEFRLAGFFIRWIVSYRGVERSALVAEPVGGEVL